MGEHPSVRAVCLSGLLPKSLGSKAPLGVGVSIKSGELCLTREKRKGGRIMPKIEGTMVLHGFAWIDNNGELNWALKEDFQGVRPEDRPEGATPVVIEISPALEWIEKKQKQHEFLGDLQEQMSKFSSDLAKIEQNMRLKGNG